MDDTIEYLVPAWLKWINSNYDYDIKPEDITTFDISQFFPDLTEDELFKPLHQEDFWKTVQPMDDAIHYIKKIIDEGYNFYIVTSSHPDTLSYKLKHVLFKYFPFVDKHNVITTYKKQLIRCDILIDDAAHNVVGPYIGILIDTPHNRFLHEEDFSGIYRVYNWKEIYNLIHTLTDQLI